MGIMMAVAADAAPAVIAVPAGPRRFSREAGRGSRATSGATPPSPGMAAHHAQRETGSNRSTPSPRLETGVSTLKEFR